MMSLSVYVLVPILIVMFAISGIRIMRRRATLQKTTAKPGSPERCRCGYLLQGVEMARCPECGRVIHFDATPEELGLTDDQLRRMQEKRRQRSQ